MKLPFAKYIDYKNITRAYIRKIKILQNIKISEIGHPQE